MGFMNKCIMLGNITRSPEVTKYGGTLVGRFGLAVNKRYKQDGETKDKTCFIDIVCFNKKAEFAREYLHKGIPVLIEGELVYSAWEKDGNKFSKHEINAENIQLVERKRD